MVFKERVKPVEKEMRIGRMSPAMKEWLDKKRRAEELAARGERGEEGWRYGWEGEKYFVEP